MSLILAISTASVLLSGTAGAGYTNVNGPHPGEASVLHIINTIYATTFNPVGTPTGVGANTKYDNGLGLALTRVSDFGLGGSLNILTGTPTSADDQFWSDGRATARAMAKYAGFGQSFGLGKPYAEKLFVSVPGGPNFLGGGPSSAFNTGANFVWGRADNAGGANTWFSDELTSAARDGRDHLVTYQVTGLPTNATVWLLFWEDNIYPNGDFDFNDLVVEVRAVPVPGAALLGVIGLAMVSRLRRSLSA